MKNLFIITTSLLLGLAFASELSPPDQAKKFSRLGFLEPGPEGSYSIEIGIDDLKTRRIMYLVNSIQVTEKQLYEQLEEAAVRFPKAEARVLIFNNLTIEEMITHTRGLLPPQRPAVFPSVKIILHPSANESIFHMRQVTFSLDSQQEREIAKFRKDGIKFPHRIRDSK